MRHTEWVACLEWRAMNAEFWWGNLKERGHLEELDINSRIILYWIFKTKDERVWTGMIWVRKATSGDLL
jgi:hypothetical protein